ncbi:MAG: TIGR03013 family PEP-CTERM/XrtA system glycosyltransferase [Planctomycetes bacterium]|nr:TIGR03013 family PEP-CTERM/XrtA system glycosyltransferase [Planctomycetota bacterium]
MLRVLRHYLPIRKALLIASETLILTLVIALWTSAHLWDPTERVRELLNNAIPAMSVDDAFYRCVTSSFLLAVVSQIAIAFNELYDVRISGSRYDRAGKFVESAGSALALTLLAVALTSFWGLKQILDFPPLTFGLRVQTIVFAMLTSFALLYYWRSFFHWLLRRVEFGERVLIIGSGSTAKELGREIIERPDAGFVLVGILPETSAGLGTRDASQRVRHAWSDAPERGARPERRGGGPTPILAGGPTAVAGGTALAQAKDKLAPTSNETDLRMQLLSLEPLSPEPDLDPAADSKPRTMLELVTAKDVGLVVVALENRRNSVPVDDLLECRLAGVTVREQESVYEQITGKIAVEALRPSYLIFNAGFSRHPWAELAKRAVDLTFSLVLLALTWPLMIVTALFVRFDSPGPILFTQERVGRDGKVFTLFKFRSMRADAEKLSGPVWATQGDPRITKSGQFIRKTRLDELPQLFNVLAGHMSLVGPRPEREHFVEDLAKKIPYFRQRHIVKPGLTGWAQINYRYGSTFEDAVQKLQFDLFYIKNQSLLFDLSILFNTVKIVILRKGT